MPRYRHLELLSQGEVSVVRLLDPRPFQGDEIEELLDEWNAVAESTEYQTLVMDCSNVEMVNSEVLSRLVSLQRRLKRKGRKLVLCGLRAHAREVLGWTGLNRYFEIKGDGETESVSWA